MGLPPHGPSAGKRSILRENQRQRPNPLAPKHPPPHEGAHGRVGKPSRRPVREDSSSITSKSRSSSASIIALPPSQPLPQAPPRASLAASPQQPPSRSVDSSVGSASASIHDAAAHLKPGSAVRVRTRTTVRMAEKTLESWLWLPATVVSATEDRSYEIVYKRSLPRHDPFATVIVASDHIVPEKRPLSSSRASSSSDSAAETLAAASKISDVQPTARPRTSGNSLRLINKLASEMQPPQRAASSSASASATARPALTSAASKASELQSAPRPTTAGKSLRLISNIWPEMDLPPRPTRAGKGKVAAPHQQPSA